MQCADDSGKNSFAFSQTALYRIESSEVALPIALKSYCRLEP